jgi:2-oxoglutarate ferredoxin oxidoreductase subunit gamma
VAVANVVMLGFLAGATDIVSVEAMKESILSSVPPGTEKLNTAAFERGLAFAKEAAAK